MPGRHHRTTPATCMPSGLGGHLPLRRCCCRAEAFRSGRRAATPAYQMLSGTPVAAADCASLGHVTDSNAGAAMAAPALFPEHEITYLATTSSKPASLMAAINTGAATSACSMVTVLVGISTLTVRTPAMSVTSEVMARTQ